jgi:rare lipoprotein A
MKRARAAKLLLAAALAAPATHAAARCKGGQTASWYGESQRVRSGARFEPDGVTCAHPTLPDGALLRVTDLDTGRSVICLVNDHGPHGTGCKVDLSRGAARAIGMLDKGLARASIEVLRPLPGKGGGAPLASPERKSGA